MIGASRCACLIERVIRRLTVVDHGGSQDFDCDGNQRIQNNPMAGARGYRNVIMSHNEPKQRAMLRADM